MTTDRVALGRIGKAHGVHGAFRVLPYADDLDRFRRLSRITIACRGKSLAANVENVTIAPGHVIVQTDAMRTPEEVQPWLGGDIEIAIDDRALLPEGRFYHDQIIGLAVDTVDGKRVGVIDRIIDGPANDVYVCRDGAKEYLIPAVDVFVKSIDLAGKRMVVDPIPGMLE